MQVIRRIGAPVILQGINGWPGGFGQEAHMGLIRGPAALLKIAGRTGRGDILPPCPATHPARDHMVKGQLPPVSSHKATILTGKAIAQKQVEPGKIGVNSGRNIFFEGNNARQPDFSSGRMNHPVIFLNHGDPVKVDCLDHILPAPQ